MFFDAPNDRGYVRLSDATVNNVSGLVTITGADDLQYASVSFRQEIVGGDMVEVTSVNVGNRVSYNINLPNGSYSVVASTLGYETLESPLTVSDAVAPIDFPILFIFFILKYRISRQGMLTLPFSLILPCKTFVK